MSGTPSKVPTSLRPAGAPASKAAAAPFAWKNAAVWLAAALLVAIPLAVGPVAAATVSPFQYLKWLLLGAGSVAMAGLGAVVLLTEGAARERVARLAQLPAVWGGVLFAAAFVAASALGSDPAVSWSVAWMVLGPLGAGAALAVAADSERAFGRVRAALIVAGIAVALIGLADSFDFLPLFSWVYGRTPEEMLKERGPEFLRAMVGGVWGRGRMIATLGNPAYVGGFLIVSTLLLAIGTVESLLGTAERRIRSVALYGAGLALCGATLLLTSTREAFLGIAAGLAIWVAMQPRMRALAHRFRFVLLILAILAGIVVASAAIRPDVYPSGVSARFAELRDLRSESVRERLIFYSVAGELFSERPVLGWGAGMYGVQFYPTLLGRLETGATGAWNLWIGMLAGRASENTHNDVFQFAVESGAVGIAGFLWLLAGILTTGWTTVRARFATDAVDGARGAAILAAWVGASVPLATSFPLRTPERAWTWWMLTGLALAWIASARRGSVKPVGT